MNINKKKLLILFLTLVLCQFQLSTLKAEDVKSIDDEELPAIDPFAGGTAGSTNQSVDLGEYFPTFLFCFYSSLMRYLGRVIQKKIDQYK